MINNKNYVTVASDASVGHSKNGSGRTGFAYYIRDDNGTTQHAWYEEAVAQSSTLAEAKAMADALKVLLDREYPENTILIYYCDNMTVIKILNDMLVSNRSKKRYSYYIEIVKRVRSKFTIDARHVPSHTGENELKRYYLNRWCDHNSWAMQRHMRYATPGDDRKLRRRK